MGDTIKVSSEALKKFKNTFGNAGESYKANLAKLTRIMDEITSGDIQGTLATELKTKFEDKKATYNKIASLIDEGEQYLGIKGTKFTNMLDSLRNSMK